MIGQILRTFILNFKQTSLLLQKNIPHEYYTSRVACFHANAILCVLVIDLLSFTINSPFKMYSVIIDGNPFKCFFFEESMMLIKLSQLRLLVGNYKRKEFLYLLAAAQGGGISNMKFI